MAGCLGRVLVGGKDCGAGFALGPRLVVTANHVIRDRNDKSVVYVPAGGEAVGVERVQRDAAHDAAILRLMNEVEFLPTSAAVRGAGWRVESPPPGGNDPQLHGTVTTARMTIKNAQDQPVEVVQLQVDEQLGDFAGYSGSAVLDAWGRAVVALLVEQKPLRTPVALGERRAASNVLYAVPIGDVVTANGLSVRASTPGAMDREQVTGRVFISYVREDSDQVDRLQETLQSAGIPVWRDTADLWPGEDWRLKIRRAITDNALVFIACFSKASLARGKSYQNEELTLAIEQLRLRPPDDPWLIPIRFDECEIPDRDIGGGRTLASIQRVDLFGDKFDAGAARLIQAVMRILRQDYQAPPDSRLSKKRPTPDDGFDALASAAGLSGREVTLLRACAKYLRQGGMRFSEDYMQRVLRSNVPVTKLLVRLFEARFDPARQDGAAERCEAIAEEIRGLLDEVYGLDHDRILRSYLALIGATLRTNYYRQDSLGGVDETLVLKLDPGSVPGLTSPRPKFEIYVYSPRLEGVHLRFGRVARGGLRWSDRLEDFRTEILGLAMAQEVKNSVIVPSGAKGGFVCKQLPDPSDREAYAAEVLACYKTFIAAMLDVTDNIEDDKVVPPPGVVRHDGDDPYLVVAADKGTATFSDTANEIAQAYGYWLGDAFASGGSEGYDQKAMGITARGAWESVKFHFATLGVDPQATEFTVAGIGDMSGDVFGNGMLLSEHILLVAAFDHRHIFLDPAPDAAASFAERRRLFALPRSSWADYDPALISADGGVWPRSAKSVPVSPQARAALGIDSAVSVLSSDELISAILAAPVDLLWNGGIGTYVKANSESHDDLWDRANDAVRIDVTRLRAKVVAEGGNLGLTQAARIEYAIAGGLVNTDFIDNSAGVDTSDHEVNIKILLQPRLGCGELTPAARSQLLRAMTDEVAALVLRQNYNQNRALAAAHAQSAQMLHVHSRYLRRLERERRMDWRLDSLPGDKEIAERRFAGLGLTVPEFAHLLAQAKISAVQEVLQSTLPDDPFLPSVLTTYFPEPLRADSYAADMDRHPLRREIVTTMVVNDMVNRSGTTFLFRMNEETRASVPSLTRAWLVARDVFGMPAFWAQVEALNGWVDVATQTTLLLEARKLTERAVRWLLHNRRPPFDIQATIDFFADGVRAVGASLPKLLSGRDLVTFTERQEAAVARYVPPDLAERVASMVPAYSAFDIVQVAASTGRDVTEVAKVYFDLAGRLQIARLRDQIVALPRDDRWSTMGAAALHDDLYAAHASLTQDVLGDGGSVTGRTSEEQLAVWVARNEEAVAMAVQMLVEIWESEGFTFTTLSMAVGAIRSLAAASFLPHLE